MKTYLFVIAMAVVGLAPVAHAKIASNSACPAMMPFTSDEDENTILNNWAEKDPVGYEACRHEKAMTAPTLEEFLVWANDTEIADDMDMSADSPEFLLNNISTGPAAVQINVSLAKQVLNLKVGDINLTKKIATGRVHHETPAGCHRAIGLEKLHWSKHYNAPMPDAVFFLPGYALHVGSVAVRSHGCVHLDPATADFVFNTVKDKGTGNTEICINR